MQDVRFNFIVIILTQELLLAAAAAFLLFIIYWLVCMGLMLTLPRSLPSVLSLIVAVLTELPGLVGTLLDIGIF